MKTKCLASLALLIALMISLPPARGGSITYEFHPREGFLGQVIGSLVVDDAALTRGGITPELVRNFSFPPFALPAMNPIYASIDATTGVSTSPTAFTGSIVNTGVLYSLYVDFGPAAFDRNIMGEYRASGGGTRGVFGRGYWTATILASAAVPEPSSLVMSLVALAFGACLAYCIIVSKGDDS